MLDTVKRARQRPRPQRARRSRRSDRGGCRTGQGRVRRDDAMDGPDPQRDHRSTAIRSAASASAARHKIVADEPCRAARRRQRAQSAGAADGGVQRLHHRRLRRRRLAQGHHARQARDPHPRRARPARLPRPQRRCRAGLRGDRLRGAIKGDGTRRAVRGNPPQRHEDLAQLLQHQPPDPGQRNAHVSAEPNPPGAGPSPSPAERARGIPTKGIARETFADGPGLPRHRRANGPRNEACDDVQSSSCANDRPRRNEDALSDPLLSLVARAEIEATRLW